MGLEQLYAGPEQRILSMMAGWNEIVQRNGHPDMSDPFDPTTPIGSDLATVVADVKERFPAPHTPGEVKNTSETTGNPRRIDMRTYEGLHDPQGLVKDMPPLSTATITVPTADGDLVLRIEFDSELNPWTVKTDMPDRRNTTCRRDDHIGARRIMTFASFENPYPAEKNYYTNVGGHLHPLEPQHIW